MNDLHPKGLEEWKDTHLTFVSKVRSFRRVVSMIAGVVEEHDADAADALMKQVDEFGPDITAYQDLVEAAEPASPEPIPMLLRCPAQDCGSIHLDEDEWAVRPHKTHQCQICGEEWRPANVPTVGVVSLPEAPRQGA